MLDENGNEVPDPNKSSDDQGGDKNNRFQDLANKVKSTAEERDKAKAEAEAAQKDAEFYKNFNTTASKFQGATEYQDQIREKVRAGYDLEDATVSVLNKEGKLTSPIISRESPVGGSATITIRDSSDKALNEMTRAEKREALEQIEKESGGVSHMLRRGL